MQTENHSGTVTRVFFSNPDSPFMAGVLELEDGQRIRFSGKCYAAQNDKLEVTGSWSEHVKFGRQFDVISGVVRMDESPEALIHLIGTHERFVGLGPARARKMVEASIALSTDGEAASALLNNPAAVAQRSGVKLEIVQAAAEVWKGRKGYFNALAALCAQGWTNAQAQTIVHAFGENAPTVVAADPYLLIGKIPRFGFRTVDVVALKLGVKASAPNRLQSGIAYCLDQMGSEGNTWCTREVLLDAAMKELRPDTLAAEDAMAEALDELIKLGVIHKDVGPMGQEVVADARLASAEFEVFDWLRSALAQKMKPLSMDGAAARSVQATLNEHQRNALHGFSQFRASLISGGAGVGKTYTMRAICDVASENRLSVELCAPTGKAAKRLATSTGREARTIHRLLEPFFDEQNGTFRFGRGPGNPVEADLVIVDEVSMVDVRLMRSLLQALSPETRILLVGDHNQIPSVSPGAILRDVLSAKERFPGAVHMLTQVVRQAGTLARNTSAILQGIVSPSTPPAWSIVKTEKGHEESMAAVIAEEVERLASSPEVLEPFDRQLDIAWDIQVLSPMKKGPLGTYALNAELQKLRQRLLGNPPPEPVAKDTRPKPLVGDRVIWTRIDYELELFNGTQAIVVEIKKGGAMGLFTEDGREVTIPGEKRAHVDLAYAMTIHKAQGSEWPYVLLVASSAHWIMHDQALLYTGASRAAGALTIFGDGIGMRHFASEKRSASRQTFGSFMVQGWEPRRQALLSFPQPVGDAEQATTIADV